MFRTSLCPSSGEQRPCYCIWCTALVLLDVVGSGCGALRCRMRARALLASYNAATLSLLRRSRPDKTQIQKDVNGNRCSYFNTISKHLILGKGSVLQRQKARSSNWVSNTEPSEHKQQVLTTQPRYSVKTPCTTISKTLTMRNCCT